MLLRTLAVLVPVAASLAADFPVTANQHIHAYIDAGQFHGAVVVAKAGKPLLRAGYGLANKEWNIPNSPDTKFRIGSITKQFTAVALLQLAEQGKLRFEDPISKYWPEAPASWEKITIHHLLTHTSGIPSYTDDPDFFPNRSMIALKPLEIVALTKDRPLHFQPGEGYRYNNTAYVLLGWVIEKVSGENYADYLRKHIFEAAGMRDSGYDTHAELIPKRASGYSPDGRNAAFLDMSLPYSAGSLYSTVDDMVKWDRALENNVLITKASFDRMITPFRNNYGYGWILNSPSEPRIMHHGGGINGFSSYFTRVLDEQLAVVVFANRITPAASRLARDLVEIYFGREVKPPTTSGNQR